MRVLGLGLAFLFCLPAERISAEQFGLFTYSVVGDTVEITNYPTDAVGDVEIPTEIAGRPVTSIGNQAFGRCTGLTSVSVPDSVTSIGRSAFYDCSGVTSIGEWAFSGCTGLTSVSIGSSVTSIGDSAFEDCSALTSVLFLGDLPSFGCEVFSDTGFTISLPSAFVPAIRGNRMTVTFAAPKNKNVTYTVETSTDLVHWTTRGLTLSEVRREGRRTASIDLDVPVRFMRLVVDFTASKCKSLW